MTQGEREYSRVRVSWPVAMLTSEKLIIGEIINVSVGGVLIRCHELPSPEEPLELRIEISYYFTVSAMVENVRFSVDDTHGDSIAYLLAARFEELTADDRSILYTAMEHEARREAALNNNRLI